MADAGLFIGFGQPVRGREAQALDIFNEAVAYYTALREQGQIEDFDAVLLEAHGGDLGGFFLLRGDETSLASVRMSDEFGRLTVRAGLIVDNFGVVAATLGTGLEQQMALYGNEIAEVAAIR